MFEAHTGRHSHCRGRPTLRGGPLRAGLQLTLKTFLLVAVLVSGTTPALAWGDLGHQMVNAAAIEDLPEPMRAYFRAHKIYFLEHASEPDLLVHQDPAEGPHHYTEIEAYDRYPFRQFERRFVTEHWSPAPSELSHGDSVWQIERYALRLAQDFRRGRWDAADLDAIFAAHYAADLTQPLHTVVNYDGQLTNQRGIHARFETDLVRDLAGRWTLQPEPAEIIPDLRARIFRELIASYSHRQVIFSADREAAAGGGYLDPRFMARFERLAGPLALHQLDAAAALVSSLWYTAWVRAGRPVLPGARGTPRPAGARTGEAR
jgi:hypothetical protein